MPDLKKEDITKEQLEQWLREHDEQIRRDIWFYDWRRWFDEPAMAEMRNFIKGLPDEKLNENHLWKLHTLSFKKISKYSSINQLAIRINAGVQLTVNDIEEALKTVPGYNFSAYAWIYEEPLVTKLRSLVTKVNSQKGLLVTNDPSSSSLDTLNIQLRELIKPNAFMTNVRNAFAFLTPWWSPKENNEKFLKAQVLMGIPTFNALISGSDALVNNSDGNDIEAINQNVLTRSIYNASLLFERKGIVVDAENLLYIEQIATVVDFLNYKNLLNEESLRSIALHGQYAALLSKAFMALTVDNVISTESYRLLCLYPKNAEVIAEVIVDCKSQFSLDIFIAVMKELNQSNAVTSKKSITDKYNRQLTAEIEDKKVIAQAQVILDKDKLRWPLNKDNAAAIVKLDANLKDLKLSAAWYSKENVIFRIQVLSCISDYPKLVDLIINFCKKTLPFESKESRDKADSYFCELSRAFCALKVKPYTDNTIAYQGKIDEFICDPKVSDQARLAFVQIVNVDPYDKHYDTLDIWAKHSAEIHDLLTKIDGFQEKAKHEMIEAIFTCKDFVSSGYANAIATEANRICTPEALLKFVSDYKANKEMQALANNNKGNASVDTSAHPCPCASGGKCAGSCVPNISGAATHNGRGSPSTITANLSVDKQLNAVQVGSARR